MIYKCKKCKNYVDDRSRACGVCGALVEKKENTTARMVPVYGRSDEDGAVRHIERYSKFWKGEQKYAEWIRPWDEVRQCRNFLYIMNDGSNIYKFDTRQYLEAGNNRLSAIDLIAVDFQKIWEQHGGDAGWGVNREGIWSVIEIEEKTKAMLFNEQGALCGKASFKGGKLQYIYGSKLYFVSEDGRVAQFDILEKISKIVWDFRKEPYYSELEKIRMSKGLALPKYQFQCYGIAANENYVVVRYSVYCDDDQNGSYVSYIENLENKMAKAVNHTANAYNISCSDLNTDEQILLYGGIGWTREEDGEDVINEDFLYGPFKIVKKKEDYSERVTDVEAWCGIIGMDMASDEIYFLWREGEGEEWKKKIYSASIRDFLVREVEKNKRLCWELGGAYECGSAGSYFCREYLYMDCVEIQGQMVILGKDGSRTDLAYVHPGGRIDEAAKCTKGSWIWGDGYYNLMERGCFDKYSEYGDRGHLFAIDTRPLSVERCLHIKRDEFKKTKEELTAKQNKCGKPCDPKKETAGRKMADTADGESLPAFVRRFNETSGKNVILQGTERTLIFPAGLFSPKNSEGGRVTGTSWNQLFIRLVNEMNVFTGGDYIEKRYLEEKNAGKQQKFIVDEAFLNDKKSVYLEKYEDREKALKQWKGWAGQWHAIDGSKYYALTSYSEQDSVKVLLSECRLYLEYLEECFSVQCSVDDLMIFFADVRQK